jgi:hypothetical protein
MGTELIRLMIEEDVELFFDYVITMLLLLKERNLAL